MRFFSVHPLPIKICHLNRSRQYVEKAVYCLITMRGDQPAIVLPSRPDLGPNSWIERMIMSFPQSPKPFH